MRYGPQRALDVLFVFSILGIIGIVASLGMSFVENEKSLEDMREIDLIFERCDYQKIMDDRNWIGFDGNKIRDHQPSYAWGNSTHYINNLICEWIEHEN